MLKLGVPTKVEDQGRVFPVSDRAGQVVQALEQYLRQQGVTVRYKSQVDGLLVKDRRCLGVQAGSHTFRAGAVVLATGGMSYPHTGSTGEGYAMARRWGHNITELFPAAVAVTCNDAWITERQVQGVSLSGVKIVLYNSGGKVMAAEQGDVIFTHWGLSGPAALRLGRAVALAQQRQPGVMLKGEMDILPDQSPDLLAKRLLQRVQEGDRRSLKNLLADWLPERLARVLVKLADISPDATWGQVDKGACQRLLALVKKLPLQITGTRPLAEATVTGGGINIKEIDPRTMGSRLIKGLFLAGEVLDVDAHTGGYNMQVAFSTGYVAGESAAACCKETLDERNTFM
ncbi:aminoacetone oxidase family FAD-binding enzyme [Desulforamulus hydrothermalis]|uniref:NAD(P)/FAD-dependent oxidoreductase n=1 Tax=Desulforamulus hydrothermalis TaxID=412895 RepID=UPI0006944B4C